MGNGTLSTVRTVFQSALPLSLVSVRPTNDILRSPSASGRGNRADTFIGQMLMECSLARASGWCGAPPTARESGCILCASCEVAAGPLPCLVGLSFFSEGAPTSPPQSATGPRACWVHGGASTAICRGPSCLTQAFLPHSGPCFRCFLISASNICDAVSICRFVTVSFHHSYLVAASVSNYRPAKRGKRKKRAAHTGPHGARSTNNNNAQRGQQGVRATRLLFGAARSPSCCRGRSEGARTVAFAPRTHARRVLSFLASGKAKHAREEEEEKKKKKKKK